MKTYHVNEIFHSIQGEGVRVGIPHVFVRFAHCNLTCNEAEHGFDCDTEFSSGRKMTAREIFQEVHAEDPRLHLHYGDLASSSALARQITGIEPDEIYNLAAQSHVRVSFDVPEYTSDIVALGTTRLAIGRGMADRILVSPAGR